MLKEEKVFKDAVHQYIYVKHPLIWDLINTKEMQRLRRIRQLGTSFYTFHGAEHSRFSHSLGVYEVTRKIISSFQRNGYVAWSEEEILLALSAALLHDIGHGPFSHSFETVFHFHHEDWTCRMLCEDTEVSKALRTYQSDLPEKIKQVVQKTYENGSIVSLISSQLDADRMDYLLRDAHFTGVNYGTFDFDRIVRMLRPYDGKIVVKENGVHAIEAYLMARYQMYWQVYFHPVTRSSEIILRKIFQRVKDLYLMDYTFHIFIDPLPKLMEGNMDIHDYFILDESFIQMLLMQWINEKDPILSDLCSRFLHRHLFKYKIVHEKEGILEYAQETLSKRGFDPKYYLEMEYPLDMPYDIYQSEKDHKKQPILIMTKEDKLIEISKRSEVIKSISGEKRGVHHLYFPEEMVQHLTIPK